MKKEKKPTPVVPGKAQYHSSPMDLGFIIMAHDGDPSKITTTRKNIERYYEGAKVTVVVPEEFKNDHVGVKVGGHSVTSLINVGMESPPAEWNVLVFAGVHIKERLDQRYSTFLADRLDIFYPLIWGAWTFIEAPLNGLCIHRDTFKEIGEFSNENSLEICKMMWFLNATDLGCKFKAVAGCRMC